MKIGFKKKIIIGVLIILCSCSNDSKKYIREIKTLKDSINFINENVKKSKLKDSIIIIETKYKNDSLSRVLKKIKSINLTNNINEATFSTPLIYTDTINDKYYTRGVYYQSKETHEKLYNIRVSIIDNHKRFYFMGIKLPLDPFNSTADIYELDENGEIYKIDSLNLLASESGEKELINENIHLKEFMLLQLDNLIIKNGRLYYYKVLKYDRESSSGLEINKKQYYEYLIGSEEKSKKINSPVYSSFVIDSPDAIMLVNPKKQLIATNLGEVIFFSRVENWTKTFNQMYIKDNAYSHIYNDLKDIKFKLSDFLPDLNKDEMYYDPETKKSVLIGGITWNSTKNKLYFDNSGMTYRCIWEIDLDKNKLTKIVPEHEAIHPYFFEINGIEYIAYTEENKIMICSL
ncbi:hypothetical protein [Tenacibaculum sp.]|uniref:hypothetical protein n=1 Tax=Tenacibaculum sp. TaxID=1906242 RepID=UPI003AA7AAF5